MTSFHQVPKCNTYSAVIKGYGHLRGVPWGPVWCARTCPGQGSPDGFRNLGWEATEADTNCSAEESRCVLSSQVAVSSLQLPCFSLMVRECCLMVISHHQLHCFRCCLLPVGPPLLPGRCLTGDEQEEELFSWGGWGTEAGWGARGGSGKSQSSSPSSPSDSSPPRRS